MGEKKKEKFKGKGLSTSEKFFICLMRGNAEQAEGYLHNMSLVNADAVNAFDENGNAPIHIAAAHGRLESCKLLVKNRCDINAKTDPSLERSELKTCLHHAAAAGVMEVCRYLLIHGADPNALDSLGKKPVFLAWDPHIRQMLQLAIEAADNIANSKEIMHKAQAAKQVFIEIPSINIVSPHPARLQNTWEAWKKEWVKLQKDSRIVIPMHKPPNVKFLVAAQTQPHVGAIFVMDKKSDVTTRNPFTGIVRVEAMRIGGLDTIAIRDLYIRSDSRRGRAGCVLMLHTLTMYAQLQYFMAYALVHNANTPAQAFFSKIGFRKLNKESVPLHVRKAMDKSSYFEMRHIGVQLHKLVHLLAQYKHVHIVQDEEYMEEEEEKVREAIKERELERQRRKQLKGTDDGRTTQEFLENITAATGLSKHKPSSPDEWWQRAPPPPRPDGKPSLRLPQPFAALRVGPPLLLPAEGPDLLPQSWHEEDPRERDGGRRGSQAERRSATGLELPKPKTAAAPLSHSVSEVDRVPDFVLKEYRRQVEGIREMADGSRRTVQRLNGGRSRILRDQDLERRSEFMHELHKFEELNTLRRNLFSVSDGVRSPTASTRPSTMRGELVSAHGKFRGLRRSGAMGAAFEGASPELMTFDE